MDQAIHIQFHHTAMNLIGLPSSYIKIPHENFQHGVKISLHDGKLSFDIIGFEDEEAIINHRPAPVDVLEALGRVEVQQAILRQVGRMETIALLNAADGERAACSLDPIERILPLRNPVLRAKNGTGAAVAQL